MRQTNNYSAQHVAVTCWAFAKLEISPRPGLMQVNPIAYKACCHAVCVASSPQASYQPLSCHLNVAVIHEPIALTMHAPEVNARCHDQSVCDLATSLLLSLLTTLLIVGWQCRLWQAI